MSDIAEAMENNEALRGILAEVRELNSRLGGEYGEIQSTPKTVTFAAPGVRKARPTAAKTIIVHISGNPVYIYEGPNQNELSLIKILLSGETWVSPLAGSQEIQCKVGISGHTASINITTYLLP